MPTYQYTCVECREPVEAVQKFTDAPLAVCDACGGRLRKVFSPVGIVFKGSGFYRTDSRKNSTSTVAAEKSGDSGSSTSTSTSTSSSSSSDSGSGTNGSSDKTAKKPAEIVSASSRSSSSSSEKVA